MRGWVCINVNCMLNNIPLIACFMVQCLVFCSVCAGLLLSRKERNITGIVFKVHTQGFPPLNVSNHFLSFSSEWRHQCAVHWRSLTTSMVNIHETNSIPWCPGSYTLMNEWPLPSQMAKMITDPRFPIWWLWNCNQCPTKPGLMFRWWLKILDYASASSPARVSRASLITWPESGCPSEPDWYPPFKLISQLIFLVPLLSNECIFPERSN